MAISVPVRAARALAVTILAAGASGADVAEQVARWLEPLQASEEEQVHELVALGAPAVVPLLDGLTGSGWSAQPLMGAPRGVAVAALAELPRAAVLAELVPRSSGDAAARVAVLDVLAQVARPGECELVLSAGEPIADEGDGTWEVQRAFERCLAALLARHPRSVSALAAMIPDAHPSLLWILVRELGETRTPEAFEALGRELGRREGTSVLLLDQLRRLAPCAPFGSLRGVRRDVRWALASTDRFVRIAACQTSAAIEDTGAVEKLISLLGEPDEAVRQAALAALEQLAGESHGPESEAWWTWLRGENTWWEAEGAADLDRARAGGEAELPAAVRRLARARLFRDQVVPALVPLLEREEPDLVRLVASVLASLGSRGAVPALESLLEHADTGVQASARSALQRLAGSPSATRARPGLQLAARGR